MSLIHAHHQLKYMMSPPYVGRRLQTGFSLWNAIKKKQFFEKPGVNKFWANQRKMFRKKYPAIGCLNKKYQGGYKENKDRRIFLEKEMEEIDLKDLKHSSCLSNKDG